MESEILVPFRLKLPDDDSLHLSGIRSVSYEVDGLLRLDDESLTLEWVARRKVETVGLTGVKAEMDESPLGREEIPLHLITGARLRGWWWAPRLDLYSRELDAFDRVPSARGSVLTLRLRPQDRRQGLAAVRAIEATVTSLPSSQERPRHIRDDR